MSTHKVKLIKISSITLAVIIVCFILGYLLFFLYIPVNAEYEVVVVTVTENTTENLYFKSDNKIVYRKFDMLAPVTDAEGYGSGLIVKEVSEDIIKKVFRKVVRNNNFFKKPDLYTDEIKGYYDRYDSTKGPVYNMTCPGYYIYVKVNDRERTLGGPYAENSEYFMKVIDYLNNIAEENIGDEGYGNSNG